MRTTTIILLFALLFIAGCVRSVAPLFSDKELIFEPRLVGTWNVGSDDAWTFSAYGEHEYRLRIVQKEFSRVILGPSTSGDTGVFAVQMGKLGGEMFIDVTPAMDEEYAEKPSAMLKNDFFNWHLLPLHSIFRVRFVNDSLRLTMFDAKWLEKMIDTKAVAIAHQKPEGNLILTASTEELQKLVAQYATDDQAFLPLDRIGHEYH